MIHRPFFRACAAVLALAAIGACKRSPTDPSRPGTFLVTFLGVPAGAESFSPRAVAAARVVGVAADGGTLRAVQWAGGAFTPVGPAAPAGCHSEPVAARGSFTVGQITCTASGDPAGQPVDAYGWIAGQNPPPRLFAEPYTFVGVNQSGAVAGTLNPGAQFPQGARRAFVRTAAGAVAVLVPPGATGSEGVGITDAGEVVVNAYYVCPADSSEDCDLSRVLAWNGAAWTEIRVPARAERAVAVAVSPEGEVAGYAFGEADQVFLYELDGNDLDVLPVIPGTRVLLSGANIRGQVVGTGVRTEIAGRAPSYGIVWGDNRQYDLSERVTGNVDVRVTAALATDDEGRIAGTGLNLETGQEGAILLVPTSL
jgi:hypothetical protein